MNYIDLDSVIAEAMTITKDASKYENVARQWAYTAMMELGSSDDEIEVCEITPKNYIAKKPDSCRQIIDIALYNSSGDELIFNFHAGKKRIHTEYEDAIDVSEDRFNIILGTNGDEVAKIKLRFFSYPLDSSGFPLIREDEKTAIMFYIRYMIALLNDDNMSKIQMDEFRWKQEADRVRAKKKASDFTNPKIKTMMRSWLRMLPYYNRNKF